MRAAGLVIAPLLFVASTLAPPAFAQTRAKAPPAAVAHGAAPAEAADGVVNLNAASPPELELLPGIGPAKARAICEHRKQHPFKKVEDIVKVKGIGRKTFANLRPYLAVDGPTTLRAPPKKR